MQGRVTALYCRAEKNPLWKEIEPVLCETSAMKWDLMVPAKWVLTTLPSPFSQSWLAQTEPARNCPLVTWKEDKEDLASVHTWLYWLYLSCITAVKNVGF